MKVNDYVRTKQRGFQYPQIAQIKSISKDSGYKNQHFIELDHNLLPDYEYRIYEEDISKSSPNIIDLIEVGDYVNGLRVNEISEHTIFLDDMRDFSKKDIDYIKSIVTKEQFESMEYKVGDDNESN